MLFLLQIGITAIPWKIRQLKDYFRRPTQKYSPMNKLGNNRIILI